MEKKTIPTISNKVMVTGFDKVSVTPEKSKFDMRKSMNIGSSLDVRCVNEPYYLSSEKSHLNRALIGGEESVLTVRENASDKVRRTSDDSPEECHYFLSQRDFCHFFVDDIIKSAMNIIRKKYKRDVYSENQLTEIVKQVSLWPKIEDFDLHLGAQKVKDFIDSTTETEENWLYTIKLHRTSEDTVSQFFVYEVIFSIPTKCFPIAQATASVYFTYEVSKVKSPVCHVDVCFHLEGFHFKMSPVKHVITDELLFRVIESKIANFKMIKF